MIVFSSHVAGKKMAEMPQGGVAMPAIGDLAAWNAGYLTLQTMFRIYPVVYPIYIYIYIYTH